MVLNDLPDYPLIVDPPEGWKYEFPRRFTFKKSAEDITEEQYQQEFEQWFLDHGYPNELIQKGMLQWCRYWTEN